MQRKTSTIIYNYHKSSPQENLRKYFAFTDWLNPPKEAKWFINVERNFISLEFNVIYGTLVNTKNSSEFSALPASCEY